MTFEVKDNDKFQKPNSKNFKKGAKRNCKEKVIADTSNQPFDLVEWMS
jgi:hypothetical protein